MNIFNRNKSTGTTELVTEAIGEGTQLSEATKRYLDQQESDAARAEDPAGWAAEQLGSFNLTPGAQLLLDRAVDNLSRNTGVGLTDEDAKFDAQQRAAIINASGNDLSVAIIALSEACDDPLDAAPIVYSLLFNVLKSAVFIANLDYRNFLDPARDSDLHLYVNYGEVGKSVGEDARDPSDPKFNPDSRYDVSPLEGQSGFETRPEFLLAQMRELYGEVDIHDEGDVVAASLRDLRYYLQLLSESFGQDPSRPMPFAFVAETNGDFTPITDAQVALDHAEVRRQASRAKKRAKQGAAMSAAAAKAREALLRRAAKQS